MPTDQSLKQHSELQAAITRGFVSNFAPNAKLLFLQDGTRQTLLFEKEAFANLGVPLADFSGLPDTILLDEHKNRVFLMQAVTVGFPTPISSSRRSALRKLFQNCTATRVYINVFLDFATFKNFIDELARETEVWVAETPAHIIHFRK